MSKSSARKTGIFAPFRMDDRQLYLRPSGGKVSFPSSRSFFAVGIALGVATLIVVMSVMNGFRFDLLRSKLGLSGQSTVSVSGWKPGRF